MSSIPRRVKAAVNERDGFECKRCGAKDNLYYDHIILRMLGGSDEAENIQILCGFCHSWKHEKDDYKFRFHEKHPEIPISDVWYGEWQVRNREDDIREFYWMNFIYSCPEYCQLSVIDKCRALINWFTTTFGRNVPERLLPPEVRELLFTDGVH